MSSLHSFLSDGFCVATLMVTAYPKIVIRGSVEIHSILMNVLMHALMMHNAEKETVLVANVHQDLLILDVAGKTPILVCLLHFWLSCPHLFSAWFPLCWLPWQQH